MQHKYVIPVLYQARCTGSSFISVDESYHNGDVRLVGGPHNWEGRVEILWNGTWGTISDSHLELHVAGIICEQLGLSAESKLKAFYPSILLQIISSRFGQ